MVAIWVVWTGLVGIWLERPGLDGDDWVVCLKNIFDPVVFIGDDDTDDICWLFIWELMLLILIVEVDIVDVELVVVVLLSLFVVVLTLLLFEEFVSFLFKLIWWVWIGLVFKGVVGIDFVWLLWVAPNVGDVELLFLTPNLNFCVVFFAVCFDQPPIGAALNGE